MQQYDVDLCVIGAGSGGLSVASGAAQLGRSVVLFEANKMGGDCLNFGCVPSKALIAAGKHAHAFSSGTAFGIRASRSQVDFTQVKAHIRDVIDHIAPVDSQERFEGLGCIVIRERARFRDSRTVVSDSAQVRAKRIVVATGSRATVPPIPGLDKVTYLTNETIFDVAELPSRLLIIGAGPIGLELGQAFSRLGSNVDIIDIMPPLPRAEPDHAEVLLKALMEEGIGFYAPVRPCEVRSEGEHIEISLEDGRTLRGSHILLAAGRGPVLDGLEPERAGIKYDKRGILTDDYLRTSNKRVYAVGDVAAGRGGLTHAAGFHAGQLIQTLYFMPPGKSARATTDRMPSAIYTAPELASIGLSEAQARDAGYKTRCVHWAFDENDRAIAERDMRGGIKIVATPKGRILGASVAGAGAGEIIQMISLAMANKIKIRGLVGFISPYPSRTEIVKRSAGSWYTEFVFSHKFKKLAGFWTRFQ